MTNSIAFVLAALIVALLVLDATVLHWDIPIMVGREMLHLIEWLSFWR